MPALKDGEEVMVTLHKLYVFLSGIYSQLHTGVLGARPNLYGMVVTGVQFTVKSFFCKITRETFNKVAQPSEW